MTSVTEPIVESRKAAVARAAAALRTEADPAAPALGPRNVKADHKSTFDPMSRPPLQLRAAQEAVPPDLDGPAAELDRVAADLENALDGLLSSRAESIS